MARPNQAVIAAVMLGLDGMRVLSNQVVILIAANKLELLEGFECRPPRPIHGTYQDGRKVPAKR